jgi:hypothetical protein
MGGWIKPFIRFFEWLAIVIDPIIAAGKTLFSVWNNENLNFFEKSISVLVASIFGLADGLLSLVGILSEGITGIWSWLTGGGWKTENPVGNYMRSVTNDYEFGGVGRQMGEATATAFENVKEKGGFAYSGESDLKVAINPEEEAMLQKRKQEFEKDGEITEQEQEILDNMIDQFSQSVDDFVMQPKGISSFIFDRKNNQMYKTSPNDEILATKKGGILDQSLQDLKSIMSEMNKNILILGLSKTTETTQPLIMNNTNVTNGKDSKEYLFKPMFDVNADKRASWWSISREYNTAT